MNIDTTIIAPRVYVLTFDTQYELCMSFVRMQEFYESDSSKFRGKYFTVEDYMDYWASEFGRGLFDYPARWNGFNLPSNAIRKWYHLFSDDLRQKELQICNSIRDCQRQDGIICSSKKYYVIGLHKQQSRASRDEVIEHEVAHALYYLYPSYKRQANALIKKLPKKVYDEAEKRLLRFGYAKKVIKDEIQAYLSTAEIPNFTCDNCLRPRKVFVDNIEKFKIKRFGK